MGNVCLNEHKWKRKIVNVEGCHCDVWILLNSDDALIKVRVYMMLVDDLGLNHVLSMCWSLWGLSPILGRRRFLAVHSSLRLSAGASGIFLPRAVRKNVHIQMRSNMVHGLVCKHLLIICKLLSTKSDNKLQRRRYSCIGARLKNVLVVSLRCMDVPRQRTIQVWQRPAESHH